MEFKLKSPHFSNDNLIPRRFTCDGENLSPALEWTGVPQNTKSFVLIMDDPDAPKGTWDHWILFNIPSNATKLEEGMRQPPGNTRCGKNSYQHNNYEGPCPPKGEHRYIFKLYAVDTVFDLPDGTPKHEIECAMQSHILVQTELVGRYKRVHWLLLALGFWHFVYLKWWDPRRFVQKLIKRTPIILLLFPLLVTMVGYTLFWSGSSKILDAIFISCSHKPPNFLPPTPI